MSSGAKILVGTSGWNYQHWLGAFYPENCPQKTWFEFYSKLFTTVEINATFYRHFTDQTYYRWYNRSPEGFKYVLKAPKLITHQKYLKNVEGQIKWFWRSASLLNEKLGLILLQLAPDTPYELDRLEKTLLAFGNPNKVAVEFRSGAWITRETKALLTDTGAVFCNSESPKIRLTDWVTSEIGYIRLHGRTQWYAYNYTNQDLHEIRDIAFQMKDQGAKTIYIFFNNDFNAFAPANAITLLDILKT